MIEFSRPLMLFLLVLLIPVWALWYRSRAGMAPERRILILVVRLVMVLALVLALAGPRARLVSDRMTVLFLVDRSLSTRAASESFARAYIDRALPRMGPRDRAGVIVFGRNAGLEASPGQMKSLGPYATVVDKTGSDLAGALRFSWAAFPADSSRRVVLLTDGNQTTPGAVEEARLARAVGVEVWAVGYPSPEGVETRVEAVDVPGRPSVDEPFEVRVSVWSNRATRGQLSLTRNGRPLGRLDVSLEEGPNVFLVSQRVEDEGAYEYSARIEVEGDLVPENNRAAAVSLVGGRSRILVAHGVKQPVGPVPDILRAQGLDVDVVSAAGMPGSLAEWQSYQAVIFTDLSALQLSTNQMELMRALVRDLGVGFAMLGGFNSFGVGGYYKTPIEDALPVDTDIRKRKIMPVVAQVLVIDKSGSMGDVEGDASKMALAREGAIAAVQLLTDRDYVGVVGFDSASKWVAPFGKNTNLKKVIGQIASMREGGGTNMYPGLQQAVSALEGCDAPIKHIIALTDGVTEPGDFKGMAARARKGKITISTVAVGADADMRFLAELAQRGNGRSYVATAATQLPRIFTRDTVVASRAAFEEKPFAAQVATRHSVLRGVSVEKAPILTGYDLTSLKPGPNQQVLTGPGGDPLLAVGRYGLGKTMAWTTDDGRKWARDWVRWPGFGQLMTQAVRWILPEAEDPGLMLEVERGPDGQARAVVEARGGDGEWRNFLDLNGRLVAPDGQGRELTFLQSAPGRYEAAWDGSTPGTWLVQVGEADGSSTLRTWTVPYAPEFSRLEPDRNLLSQIAEASGGQYSPVAEDVFQPAAVPTTVAREVWYPLLVVALLLLPLDVALRRVFLPEGFWAGVRSRFSRKPRAARAEAPPDPTVGALMGAKKKLRESIKPFDPVKVETAREEKVTAAPPPAREAPPKAPEKPAPAPAPAPEAEPESSLDRLKKAKKRRR